MIDFEQWRIRWGIPQEAIEELVNPQPENRDTGYQDEQEAKKRTLVWAAQNGISMWRNNSGVLKNPETGHPVRFGLGNTSAKINKKFKSSDLIGVTPVKVLPPLVGQTIGVFTAWEVKHPNWTSVQGDHEKAQENYLLHVKSKGGIAGFIRGPSDAYDILRKEHLS